MAGNLADYAENKLLDHVLGRTSYTKPTVYLALFTADPGEAGPGTEVSGGSYARQALSVNAAASGATANSEEIKFPVASGEYGTVTHIAVFDASTSGNMLWHAPLNASKVIQTGDQFVVASGDLTFSLD